MCSSESFCPRLRCPTQHAGTSRAYSRKERQLEGRRDSDRHRSILTAFAPGVPFSVGANRFSSSHIGARRGPVEARAKGIVFRWRFDRLSVPTTVARPRGPHRARRPRRRARRASRRCHRRRERVRQRDSKKATCSWKSTASPSSTTAPFPSFALGSSASSTRVLESSLCAFFDGAPSSRSM